jgi:HD-GYP domain-containing protein (c-di-GMP phosphodiesterase class II)
MASTEEVLCLVGKNLERLRCRVGLKMLLADLNSLGAWEALIGAEPELAMALSEEEFDAALLAIANFVDLKSPYTLGHSAAVAELAARATILRQLL